LQPFGFDKDFPPTTRKLILAGLNANAQPGYKFKGQIDDFRIYNYALENAFIERLAGRGPPVQNDIWFFPSQKHYSKIRTVKAVQNKVASKAAKPDLQRRLYSLQTPRNFRDDYGQRLICWIEAPTTGVYKFQFDADDAMTLAIDAPRAGKEPYTYKLTKEHRYKVEVLHKEDAGDDYFHLKWRPPEAKEMQPIPGSVLRAEKFSAAR